jgi:hypothetical protein
MTKLNPMQLPPGTIPDMFYLVKNTLSELQQDIQTVQTALTAEAGESAGTVKSYVSQYPTPMQSAITTADVTLPQYSSMEVAIQEYTWPKDSYFMLEGSVTIDGTEYALQISTTWDNDAEAISKVKMYIQQSQVESLVIPSGTTISIHENRTLWNAGDDYKIPKTKLVFETQTNQYKRYSSGKWDGIHYTSIYRYRGSLSSPTSKRGDETTLRLTTDELTKITKIAGSDIGVGTTIFDSNDTQLIVVQISPDSVNGDIASLRILDVPSSGTTAYAYQRYSSYYYWNQTIPTDVKMTSVNVSAPQNSAYLPDGTFAYLMLEAHDDHVAYMIMTVSKDMAPVLASAGLVLEHSDSDNYLIVEMSDAGLSISSVLGYYNETEGMVWSNYTYTFEYPSNMYGVENDGSADAPAWLTSGSNSFYSSNETVNQDPAVMANELDPRNTYHMELSRENSSTGYGSKIKWVKGAGFLPVVDDVLTVVASESNLPAVTGLADGEYLAYVLNRRYYVSVSSNAGTWQLDTRYANIPTVSEYQSVTTSNDNSCWWWDGTAWNNIKGSSSGGGGGSESLPMYTPSESTKTNATIAADTHSGYESFKTASFTNAIPSGTTIKLTGVTVTDGDANLLFKYNSMNMGEVVSGTNQGTATDPIYVLTSDLAAGDLLFCSNQMGAGSSNEMSACESCYIEEVTEGHAGMVDDDIMGDYAKKTDLEDYVEKENGKDLSTNDYSNAEKAKVASAIQKVAGTVVTDNNVPLYSPGGSTTYNATIEDDTIVSGMKTFSFGVSVKQGDSIIITGATAAASMGAALSYYLNGVAQPAMVNSPNGTSPNATYVIGSLENPIPAGTKFYICDYMMGPTNLLSAIGSASFTRTTVAKAGVVDDDIMSQYAKKTDVGDGGEAYFKISTGDIADQTIYTGVQTPVPIVSTAHLTYVPISIISSNEDVIASSISDPSSSATTAIYLTGLTPGETTITVKAPGWKDATFKVTVVENPGSITLGSTMPNLMTGTSYQYTDSNVMYLPTTLSKPTSLTLNGYTGDGTITVSCENWSDGIGSFLYESANVTQSMDYSGCTITAHFSDHDDITTGEFTIRINEPK